MPTSIINGYLSELIAQTATHVKQPKNTVLVATYNKKTIPDGEFIFQSFFDQNKPEVEKSKLIIAGNSKCKPPTLAKFDHADD